MLIEINRKKRYVDIWLLGGESAPNMFEICQQYSGYDIAVFHSGKGRLDMLTAELLKANC